MWIAPLCAGRRLQQSSTGGAGDGRGCIDRGSGLWLCSGGKELGYTAGTFDLDWALPTPPGPIPLAFLSSETIVGSETASGQANQRFPNRYTTLVPILRTDVVAQYGALCSCCALCLAQNKNAADTMGNQVGP